jgi:poly(beta-D-mannuronate) lyase
VQHTLLQGNNFLESGAVRFTHTVGKPALLAARNSFTDTPEIEADVTIEIAE